MLNQAGLSILATCTAAVVCCLTVWIWMPPELLRSAQIAACVGVMTGCLTTVCFCVVGTSPSAQLLGISLRILTTLGFGAIVAKTTQCWNETYFLTLAFVYTVNLVSETWMIYTAIRK